MERTKRIEQHFRTLASETSVPQNVRIHEGTHIHVAGLELAFDDIESLQCSRYQEPRAQNWLSRLVNRPIGLDDVVQIQVRSAREEHCRLESIQPPAELLEPLPWLDVKGTHIPLVDLAHAVTAMLDSGAHIIVGPPNARPEAVDVVQSRWSRKQRVVLALAQSTAGNEGWTMLTRALDRCSDKEVVELQPVLGRYFDRWPDDIRRAPRAWLMCLLDAANLGKGELNPRLAFASPHLTHIKRMDCSRSKAASKQEALERLMSTPHLAQLEEMIVGATTTDEGIGVIANAPYLGSLKTLSVCSNTAISHKALECIAASPHLPHLTELDLNLTNIGQEGAAVLASSPRFSQLTSLHLSRSVGRDGAFTIVQSESLKALTQLDLSHSSLLGSGGKILRDFRLPALEALSLESNMLGDTGAEALAESPAITSLKTLDLSWNKIGNTGARALLTSPFIASLKMLDLSWNTIQDAGAKAILTSPYAMQLDHLKMFPQTGESFHPSTQAALSAWAKEHNVTLRF